MAKALADLSGPSYTDGQSLVEQVAFVLSDKVYSYGTEEQQLDLAVQSWSSATDKNAFGRDVSFSRMQTRSGAASMILGDIFSRNVALTKKDAPTAVLASSSSLIAMKPVLDQLAALYDDATPLVAHVSSLDLSARTSNFVSDYTRALLLSRDGQYAVVNSVTTHDTQHMALLATALSSQLPAVHIYDGIRLAKETTRVGDVLDSKKLAAVYSTLVKQDKAQIADKEEAVRKIVSGLNAELGTAYAPFEYHGPADAKHVLVTFGSQESSLTRYLAQQTDNAVGVINVRIYRPFLEQEFLQQLPASASRVSVLGQVLLDEQVDDVNATSVLYGDVLGAIAMSDDWSAKRPAVIDVKYARDTQWTLSKVQALLQAVAAGDNKIDVATLPELSQQTPIPAADAVLFWDFDEAVTRKAAKAFVSRLTKAKKDNVASLEVYDNYAEGGLVLTEARTSSKIVELSFPVEAAHAVVVNDTQILRAYDVTGTLAHGGSIAIRAEAKPEDFEKKLNDGFKVGVATKDAKLFYYRPSAFSELGDDEQAVLAHLVAARVASSQDLEVSVIEAIGSEHSVSSDATRSIADKLKEELHAVEVPAEWKEIAVENALPSIVIPNALAPNTEKEPELQQPNLTSWQTAAQQLAFKEAYAYDSTLRPDLAERTWEVSVQANRRLTPTTYDRNIFHIEFDITGTGLKYELGESLGVHGHNDPKQVLAFLQLYGLNPNDLVQVPSRTDTSVFETRTVQQAFEQNIDLFGRPAKKFYESLATYASDEKQRKVLSSLSTPEGAVDFKRRAEVETVTYADLLEEFSSARPPLEDLVQLIPPTKRREYSISSSQKVHENSVHLLVVVVDWKDQRDRERFGHCTRYLSNLEIGEKVTVSLKPSVMKLPPRPEQPIIMAGLGTGLAPFRAFVEERAWQKARGEKIGAVMLYLGSRHQKEEYLYGEEWEAYRDAGIITLLGQAFSRDQPKKVYIQDIMRSTIADIQQALIGQEGSFYLCGPTWPVPDVQEVLEEAIRNQANQDGNKVESNKVIEELKDAHRYVLEVY
ncbi:sulfite reductase [NADPH] flavoprotein component [Savitreella phatthalungensis]